MTETPIGTRIRMGSKHPYRGRYGTVVAHEYYHECAVLIVLLDDGHKTMVVRNPKLWTVVAEPDA